MKKLIVLLSILPSFAFAQTFDRDLYFGIQEDSDVTKLQEFLTDQNAYSGPITGNFFSLTLQGVKVFQTRQGISPISGYFGPKSRAAANQILAAEGITSAGVTNESGSTIPAVTVPPKTTTDVVVSLMAQIQLLQQQLNALQAQQQTLQTIQQQQTTQTQQITQQTQTLQQIQQNTALIPTQTVTNVNPEIIHFGTNKTTANIGDEITLTWEAKNAVTCAIVETDNISIPFTGRLPSGTLSIKLAETAYLKVPNFKYFAICADKEWHTAVQTLSIIVSKLAPTPPVSYCPAQIADEIKTINNYLQADDLAAVKTIVNTCAGQLQKIYFMLPQASYYQDPDIVSYLLDSNFNIDYWDDLSNGFTALMHAASKANLNIAQLLIDRGANVNVVGQNGMTALLYSFVTGKGLEVPTLLLSKGANPNAANSDGVTPLFHAPLIGLSATDAVKLLLNYGAGADTRSNNGSAPIMSAVWAGNLDAVKLLVAAGANVNIQTNAGDTPLSWATQKGYIDIVAFLQQVGATK